MGGVREGPPTFRPAALGVDVWDGGHLLDASVSPLCKCGGFCVYSASLPIQNDAFVVDWTIISFRCE